MANSKFQGVPVSREHAEACIDRCRKHKEISIPSHGEFNVNSESLSAYQKECGSTRYTICLGLAKPNKTKCLKKGMSSDVIDKMPDAVVAVFVLKNDKEDIVGYFEDIFLCPPLCDPDDYLV